MRRLRNRKQRAKLFLDYEGRCAICGMDLINWHADHKIPFKLTLCTKYSNMQPLCSSCNLNKGAKVLNSKNRNYFETINLGLHVDIAPFRIGQKGSFNCIVEKIMDHSSTVSIVLPTRYGKSDVIRASAIELIERGIASGSLVVAPCKFLRDQLTNKNKVDEMAKRYSIATNRPITYDILDNFRLPIFQNNEYFVGLTNQMLVKNADEICIYINQIVKKTGKTFLVYIDESHTQSDINTWGSVVPKIVESGGKVILCTATPFRDDGKKIPGFNCCIKNKREKKRYVPRQHEDEKKYHIDVYNDIEGDMHLEADYDYSFKSAWAEEDVICKVARREFDVVVRIPDEKYGTKEINISEMTLAECRRYLGRVNRDPKVIKAGVKELLDRMNDYRLFEPTAQAIIFCGNDINEEEDGHAKKIAEEISCLSTKFKVIIATSKQEESDLKIKQFGEGKGDILIVKQMASLGMDIPSIKIGLDLSAVRTLAAFIQRMMRTATMWGKNKVAHLIIPSDVIGSALWNGFIEENGGNMIIHDSTKIDSFEKDKQEKDPKSKDMEVIRTESSVLSDNFSSERTYNNNDYNNFALPLIREEPKLQAILTDQELINLGQKIGIPTLNSLNKNNFTASIDIAEQRKLIKNKINKLSGEIASINYNYGKNHNEWVQEKKNCINRAKKSAGIHPTTKMENIANVDKLTLMRNFLQNKLDELSIC